MNIELGINLLYNGFSPYGWQLIYKTNKYAYVFWNNGAYDIYKIGNDKKIFFNNLIVYSQPLERISFCKMLSLLK